MSHIKQLILYTRKETKEKQYTDLILLHGLDIS